MLLGFYNNYNNNFSNTSITLAQGTYKQILIFGGKYSSSLNIKSDDLKFVN